MISMHRRIPLLKVTHFFPITVSFLAHALAASLSFSVLFSSLLLAPEWFWLGHKPGI